MKVVLNGLYREEFVLSTELRSRLAAMKDVTMVLLMVSKYVLGMGQKRGRESSVNMKVVPVVHVDLAFVANMEHLAVSPV